MTRYSGAGNAALRGLRSGGALVAALLFSAGAPAAITCTSSGTGGIQDTLNVIPANISVGTDVAVGAEIYKGRYERSDGAVGWLSCVSNIQETLSLRSVWRVTKASPYGMAGPVPASPYNGRIYQSGIPGVGVVLSAGSSGALTENDVFTIGNKNEVLQPGVAVSPPGTSMLTAYITLVKTGDIPPGVHTFSAADFPVLSYRWESTGGGVTGIPYPVVSVGFSGALTMNVQTCQTPDVTVPMGSHDINKFSGAGSVTPWVDASLTLTGCPAFHGFYRTGNPSLLYKNGIPATPGESLGNSVSVRITPATTIVDAANGMMALTPASDAAGGVAIQLGWGDPGASPVPFDFALEKSVLLPKTGQATLRIPMSARYIATGDALTPGKADGSAIFILNYY